MGRFELHEPRLKVNTLNVYTVQPENLVVWQFSKGIGELNSAIFNSIFGTCGLLCCSRMVLILLERVFQQGFPLCQRGLKEANASVKHSLENETSKPEATST